MKETHQTASVAHMLQLATVHYKSGKMPEAETTYRQILAAHPQHFDSLHMLGIIAFQTGRYKDAENLFEKALKVKKDAPVLFYHLGLALQEQGKLDNAVIKYRCATALKPDYIEAYCNAGTIFLRQEKFDEAAREYERAVTLRPDMAELHYNLAKALQKLGRLKESYTQYELAITLKPDYAEAYSELGTLLKKQCNLEDALKLQIKAVALNPRLVMARYNLGNTLKEQDELDDAAAQYTQALALKPDYFEAHINLGEVYIKQGKFNVAAVQYEQALALNPDSGGALSSLVHTFQHMCAWDKVREHETRLLKMVRKKCEDISPFTTLCLSSTPADQLACAHTYGQKRSVPTEQVFQHTPERQRERLRIGYLSADFHQHATAYLMAELFERHDRSRFEITGYSCGKDDHSDLRQRLIQSFDHFTDLRSLSDHTAAQKIYDDGIDILIDLKGYTENNRIVISALRPAPIQVNYLGYPGTMGVDFVDYIIADRFILPMEHQPFYSEKIVQLPNCYQPNDTTRQISSHTPTRADYGLTEKGFVFCSFNNSYKITSQMFDVWMKLLKNLPDSVLWLLEANRFVKDNLRQEAIRRGITADRLVFAPRMPLPEHLARHRLADLFLDTLPVNAHTTASDALWAGLPVLTCVGDTFAARVAGSLLTAANLPELITYSLQDYEALALQLARNPEQLSVIRKKLEQTRLDVPLFDIGRFVKNIESAYGTMWQTWQAGDPPRAFAVSEEK